ncbi:MAG TPA: hypothetical protein VJQ84_06460 [Solirubrobacterales bacterium]|nr:hypothetical protein [Solirubrobacterales bacterium]
MHSLPTTAGTTPSSEQPPTFAIDEAEAIAGGFYLGHNHKLIHRHLEQIDIAPNHTARWQLTIDLELPTDPGASCGVHNGECLFLFPLVFLKKAEGRTRFNVRDESGNELPQPVRGTCDWITAMAATAAAGRIEGELRKEILAKGEVIEPLGEEALDYALRCVSSFRPYDASVILNEILHRLRLRDERVAQRWQSAGLTADLKMLVEHWLLWVPLRGLPGERRRLSVSQDVELLPRPFFRWRIGPIDEEKASKQRLVFDTGTQKYGKIGWRVDFSVLGERLALPLAWMPIDFDFPTIYTRRCSSYHFELVCPNGLSPRGIKIARGPEHDEEGGESREGEALDATETMGTRAGVAYLPGGREVGDITVRATIGIGKGAFPVLWLLMGVVTASMLWYLVAAELTDLITRPNSNSKNEIAAGILLVVPALLGAIAVGFEGSITRLIAGARNLLIATGLASGLAATVLIGREPLGLSALTQWTLCASLATAATVPLAASWLLSLPLVRRQMQRLDTTEKQYSALEATSLAAILVICALMLVDSWDVGRMWLAIALLVITVPFSLLAANRLPVPVVEKRDFISFGTVFSAFVVLVLGCFELHCALIEGVGRPLFIELLAALLLVAGLYIGPLLSWLTGPYKEQPGEIHLGPGEARPLLEGRRVRGLRRLRSSDGEAGGREGSLSWGVWSTADLPDYQRGELASVCGKWPRRGTAGKRQELEEEASERLPKHVAMIWPGA